MRRSRLRRRKNRRAERRNGEPSGVSRRVVSTPGGLRRSARLDGASSSVPRVNLSHPAARVPSVFDLRPMTVADVPDALALWDGMPGLSLFPSDSVEGIGRYLERNPGLSVVLRVGGRLVGAALAGHDGRRGFLHHVAVAPDYRRRGLGRAMVEWCVGRLADAGVGRCLILVNAGNEEAKAFWRRIGWDDRPVQVMARTMDAGKA